MAQNLRLQFQVRCAVAVLTALASSACDSLPSLGLDKPPPPAVPTKAPPPPPPLRPAGEVRAWSVVAGETAADTVRRWAAQAGYTPVPRFTTRENWRLIVSDSYQGSFEQALQWLSDGFSRQALKPQVELHANHTLDLLGMPGDDAAGERFD